MDKSFGDQIVELAVKALDIMGHGDITKVIADPEDEGLFDGIEVVKYDDNQVAIGGWIKIILKDDTINVSLYGPGHRGAPTLMQEKDFDADYGIEQSVAWAMGKMLEYELREAL